VFSARSAAITAHATMDTTTEERCFLCGPCLDVLRRTELVGRVQLSEESSLVSNQRTAGVQSL
jgi:hypothetical protein